MKPTLRNFSPSAKYKEKEKIENDFGRPTSLGRVRNLRVYPPTTIRSRLISRCFEVEVLMTNGAHARTGVLSRPPKNYADVPVLKSRTGVLAPGHEHFVEQIKGYVSVAHSEIVKAKV